MRLQPSFFFTRDGCDGGDSKISCEEITVTTVIAVTPLFLTSPGRRSHACSLESPHPAEPPNAVTRSRRKYHSGVARIGYSVVKVPGAYKPLYLSNGQKIRGWPTFSGGKKFFYCPLTYNGNDGSHFARSGEKYFFSSVFPSPITAKKTAIFRARVQSFEKYIFRSINCPSPITERENSFS